MAQTKKSKAKTKSVLTETSYQFLKNYINTPSPVGFESGGLKYEIVVPVLNSLSSISSCIYINFN